MILENGTIVGHYQIISALGKGGMGEVYLAEDTKLDRKVALKILPAEFAGDQDRMNRFVREAKSASSLNHPNIITIYEIGESEGTHYIATEFIQGETIHKRLKQSSLEIKLALDLVIQVASGLDAAHQAGIIHRDLKPDNVMIRPDGLVKLLDFGIAKLIGDLGFRNSDLAPFNEESKTLITENNPQPPIPNPKSTTPGMVIGTANYMSPEQARGKEIDGRSDIFSFGLVLYEILTNKRAFEGETPLETLSSILRDEIVPIHQIRPEVPLEIENIVNKMLQKDRDRRYSSIAELLVDLRQVKQRIDYEELERTLSPEQPTAQFQREKQDTAILSVAASGSNAAISTKQSQILPPHNLTAELSPLIGRETEMSEIIGLLRRPDIRLVTITGVGGTGKTRLSQAIAHESLTDFSDGVYFVNLSAVESSELVIPTIAQTLGFKEERGSTLLQSLGEHLYEKKILIVLDNFEQIASAAPQIGELLSGSINLKILVTSRIRLQLRFEREFILQPLEVPTKENLSLNKLSEYPSIELFVERAQAVKPAFALTQDNAESIVQICRKLDGLPLAIELAAVRVKLLAPQAILMRLSNSLKLLTGGARDLPERQQTMRATIAWSYDLLEPEEKKLLNRLAVFAGGFTLEAAEAVCENDELTKSQIPNPKSQIDLLDMIASLVDKSLLLQRERSDGEPWFRMLGVVREFALEALEESGEAHQIKRFHTKFYTELAEMFEPEFDGPDAAQWLENLEQEHDNIRAVLEWALEHRQENALAIVGAIRSFWNRRGYLSEASKWIKLALEKNGEDADPKLLAKAYLALGDSTWGQGDSKTAARSYQESLRFARQINDKFWISTALRGLGYIRRVEGNLSEAKQLIEESLELARELNDTRLISLRLNSLGEIARAEDDYEVARRYYEEALAIAKKVPSVYLISIYSFNLAAVVCLQGDYQAARLYGLESLKINQGMEDKIGIGDVLNLFAALAVKAGNAEKAGHLFGVAQATYDAIGYKLEKVDREFVDLYLTEAQETIGQEAFEAVFKEGQAMSLKKAIALAQETV